jgi:uncharacterized membrane protein
MEETFKKEEINALKEKITLLEEENQKLLLQFQKAGKLNESIERTGHIAKSFGCVIFAIMVAVPIIPEGRFIALITASLLFIPASIFSYIFW